MEKVAPRLDTALSFLSGDVWRTSFHKSSCELFIAPKTRRKKTLTPDEPDSFDAVTLFSGGWIRSLELSTTCSKMQRTALC